MVFYDENDPILCWIFPSGLKGVASDWFYSLPSWSIHNFEVIPSCSSRSTPPASSSSRTIITFSLSRWDPLTVLRRMLDTFRVHWPKYTTAVRMSLLPYLSASYESPPLYWWCTMLPVGVKFYTKRNHTSSWRSQRKAPSTSHSTVAMMKYWSHITKAPPSIICVANKVLLRRSISEPPTKSTPSLSSGWHLHPTEAPYPGCLRSHQGST